MKKLMLIGIALFAAFMFVVPASATTLELGGYYRVEGRILNNPSLDEDATGSHDAHWRMRFRFTPALVVSDALRFDFKTDIFDGTKFGNQGSEDKSTNLMDIDRLWMTITVPFGKFAVGRMAGNAWGLSFLDNNEDYDRIRFDTKVGKVTTGIIFQKNVDLDYSTKTQSDRDLDVYYLYGVYKDDFGAAGLLGAYVNNKTTITVDNFKYALLPYFDVKFGGVGLRGELLWSTGEKDPDLAGAATTDTNEFAWTLQADYSFGPVTVGGGYAWVQGTGSDPLNDKSTNFAGMGLGDDWDLFIVATDVDQIVNENSNAWGILTTGVKMWYADAEWKINKAWTATARVGGFTAEDVPTGVDDKIGMEYDLDISWAVMKNLKWRFTGGYFDTGDYFNALITHPDNTYTLRHQLTLSF